MKTESKRALVESIIHGLANQTAKDIRNFCDVNRISELKFLSPEYLEHTVGRNKLREITKKDRNINNDCNIDVLTLAMISVVLKKNYFKPLAQFMDDLGLQEPDRQQDERDMAILEELHAKLEEYKYLHENPNIVHLLTTDLVKKLLNFRKENAQATEDVLTSLIYRNIDREDIKAHYLDGTIDSIISDLDGLV